MINFNNGLKGLLIALFLISLAACGGSGSEIPIVEQVGVVDDSVCATLDSENTDSNCGTLLLGITDAEGDFLSYTVDVTGLELTRADGTQVSVMPSSQSVNFAEYVEVSELATAATIPIGVYTSGSITIDYSNADIQVEKDGVATVANMVDSEGTLLTSETLQLQFDENNQLVIAYRRPAMLEIDFNLAASHTVNLENTPVTVTTEPFIVAEIDPVWNKEFRVRGPLISVNLDELLFRIAVRPFHRDSGRFGGVNIKTNDETNFEVDGVSFVGSEGLTQMATLEAGTPTITLGVFNRSADRFTAITVIAGSGVPGADRDAARGVIVARQGNVLTVKGASLIRQDGIVDFNDEITVLIDTTTLVSKNRRLQDDVTIDDLSVGQAVTILGTISRLDDSTTIDATEGAIRMRLTFASGHAISDDQLSLTMALQALQGRTPETYDFTGTGTSPEFDADPDNYEVSVENMMVTNVNQNDPIRVSGFINEFAAAPADFNAMTVVNYAESRSQILVNWPTGDAVVAFSEISSERLVINTNNEGEGVYKLIQGGIRTELTSFDMPVTILPLGDRGFYSIKAQGGISHFSNFADFTSLLQLKLDEGGSIDLMHATGGFSTESKTLSAIKIAIKLN